jgi:glutamate 5-kinase|tara:strand:- start:4193 stop:5314 length:1122 start_codon:yes stop_codon:yes gene_type:complete
MTDSRVKLRQANRWVIKIGSSLLTAGGVGLDQAGIAIWVDQIAALHRRGLEVVLVSSGAVVEGMARMAIDKRPHALHTLQAAAAVGQMGLIQIYESNFQRHNLHTAQILLTHDDMTNRERYINARSTLQTLISMDVIPVVNENDTVVTDEIRFGDNDALAAMVTNLIEADALLVLTDQDGLYDGDPRRSDAVKLISEAMASDDALDQMAGGGSHLGRGGMKTKIKAARMAARSGASTVIAAGRSEDVITRVVQGESLGSLLKADREVLVARKQWLAGLQAKGSVMLDPGAVKVLRHSGRSLLPVGVTSVSGNFTRGDMVACVSETGLEIARGLCNYSAIEARCIIGHPSDEIEALLGYMGDEELIHRDNLVLL